MSEFDALIDLIPIGDIADKLGIDESIAKAAVKAAVPVIVGGLAANATSAEGEKKLEGVLTRHGAKAPKGKAKIADIDEADGAKIVGHVFGAKQKDVTAAVAEKSGNATQEIIAQVLPIIAPIVLAWVGQQFLGQKPAAAPEPEPEKAAPSTSGAIGDLLGGLLASKEGQEMIGGVIGSLLGAKK